MFSTSMSTPIVCYCNYLYIATQYIYSIVEFSLVAPVTHWYVVMLLQARIIGETTVSMT